MKKPESPSTYRERTRERLRVIVLDAAGEPSLTVSLELREVGPNAAAFLAVRWRAHPRLPDPDDLERAILELLYLRGRMRHRDIVAVLENETDRSARTIARRLEKLKDLGVIRLSRKPPRGYDLDPPLRAHVDASPVQSA